MSGPPPNYPGTPGQQTYYASPDQKSQYGPGHFSPPPQQQQHFPPPPGTPQQYPPPPATPHQYPPPPATPHQYPPPPTSPQQYPPPPGQPPTQGQQQYFPPPPMQQQFASPPPPAQSPGQFAPPPESPRGYDEKQQLQQLQQQQQQQQQPVGLVPVAGTATTVSDTIGAFDGGQFKIEHRDSNTILMVNLRENQIIYAKPGAMIAMSSKVTLRGALKVNLKKILAGSEMSHSVYTGPGEVILAPPALGDIIPIRLDGQTTWSVGKDAYLASTPNVKKDLKTQGLGKAMFSGEGLFVYKISGTGIIWITSLGAIISKHISPDESYIVDNDHLVAWNCKYSIERVASGGILSGMAAAEGLVCKFTGPGTVFVQTRNPTSFAQWLAARTGASGGGSALGSLLG